MPPYAWFEPLNITVFNNKTANLNWVWDRDGAGTECAVSTDGIGLNWSVSGSTVTASSPSAYYTFTGSIGGDQISGDILHGTDTVGTWFVIQNAPQVASLCGQPAPPNIWPLPSNFKMGTTTLMVSPSSNFFTTTAKSSILAAAFQRYVGLIFPHSSSMKSSRFRFVSQSAPGSCADASKEMETVTECRRRMVRHLEATPR
jgi:hypothetical protein